MNDDVNIWICPDSDEIYVTDNTAGVPVGACNWSEFTSSRLKRMMGDDYGALFEFKGEKAWENALRKANELKLKMPGFDIKYDNWYGRMVEAENRINDRDDDDDY